MKKISFLILGICLFAQMGFAGGIVTNTNQSAAWVRTLVRDASINTDAVYFNPAGVARMADGFYVEVNNQSIKQTRTITNNFPLLQSSKYEASVSAPFFPSAYVAYKKGNFAIHGGFAVVGGGGSATYEKGLPSFEIPISGIPAGLKAKGIPTDNYSADIYFSGSSTYMGIQVGASYKFSEFIAIGVGLRYIMATNTYEGHVKNIMINPTYPAAGFTGSMVSAPLFFTTMQGAATSVSNLATSAATKMQPLITGGAGPLTFAGAEGLGAITPAQRAEMEGGLRQLGMTQTQIDALTIAQAQGAYKNYAKAYTDNAKTMGVYAKSTADIDVDAEQKGTSISPIFSVDLSLLDGDLGIAVKYEHKAPLEMTNATKIDGSGMFPDKAVVPSEMPSLLSVGVRYSLSDKLRTQVGLHYYMDKSAKYGKQRYKYDPLQGYVPAAYVTNGEEVKLKDGTSGSYIDGNSFEAGISLEYDLNKMFTVSAGYIYAAQSPTSAYQTDMNYSLNTNTIGFGAAIHLIDRLEVNLGFLNTFYKNSEKTTAYSSTINVLETYDKTTYLFAIGLGYRFGK